MNLSKLIITDSAIDTIELTVEKLKRDKNIPHWIYISFDKAYGENENDLIIIEADDSCDSYNYGKWEKTTSYIIKYLKSYNPQIIKKNKYSMDIELEFKEEGGLNDNEWLDEINDITRWVVVYFDKNNNHHWKIIKAEDWDDAKSVAYSVIDDCYEIDEIYEYDPNDINATPTFFNN